MSLSDDIRDFTILEIAAGHSLATEAVRYAVEQLPEEQQESFRNDVRKRLLSVVHTTQPTPRVRRAALLNLNTILGVAEDHQAGQPI